MAVFMDDRDILSEEAYGWLPSLPALWVFEVVGRTGSMRAAAHELGVGHAGISRHIAHLQDVLGIRLFLAKGRGIELTGPGRIYHARVSLAFSTITSAIDRLAFPDQVPFVVWCSPGLAEHILLPALPALVESLPAFEIRLQPTLSRANLQVGEADAEIVYLAEPCHTRDVELCALAPVRMLAVASPLFLERHGRVATVDQLLTMPLLHEDSSAQWERWLEAMGHDNIGVLPGIRLWHSHLTIEAARLGQGIALASALFVANDVAEGRLVEVLSTNVTLGGYYLAVTDERSTSPEIVRLREWLSSTIDAIPQIERGTKL